MAGEILFQYLAMSAVGISVVLVREIGTNYSPVYFFSKASEELKTRYQKIEKGEQPNGR